MRRELIAFAIPAGIVTCAPFLDAEVFLTEDQALRSLFGDSRIDRQQKSLSEEDRQVLSKATGLRFPESSFTIHVAERDSKVLGYAVVMNEIGKSEPITFMVAISPEHRVIDVLVMVFRESRGAEVRELRFLRQFKGKQASDAITINNDIVNYSGATLSSKAIARGVKRALGLVNYFYPAPKAAIGLSPALLLPAMPMPGQCGMHRQVRYAMGTLCDIRLEADSSAHASAAASAAFSEIHRLEKVFSAYDPESELSWIHREAASGPVPVSRDMWDLVRAAKRYARATAGAVDITVGPLLRSWGFRGDSTESPADALKHVGFDKVSLDARHRTIRFLTGGIEMDFGGLAKGYAARCAVDVLRRWEAPSALINLGGSSIVTSEGGRPWLAGVADPRAPERYAAILAVKAGMGVTCSGTYERRVGSVSHIMDPRTGEPLTDLRAAVAITKSPLAGEVISKGLLLGCVPSRPAAEYLVVTHEGIDAHLSQTALFTPGLES